eukprot:SM000049S16794  [mRNA]  locus=s49:777522:779211:- [translate_table: standard]
MSGGCGGGGIDGGCRCRQLAVARGLNGVALAWSAPAIYSMVADTAEAANRGVAFGLLRVAGISDMVIGGGAAILLAGSAPADIPGWRVGFLLTAAICFVLSAAIHAFVDDPHYSAGLPRKETSGRGPGSLDRLDHLQQPSGGRRQFLDEMLADTWSVVPMPTFQIIVAQGMLGSFHGLRSPSALCGLSSSDSSTPAATSVGALLGAWLGNTAARWLPNSGLILCAQVSAGSAALFCTLLLHGLPNDVPRPLLYAATLIPMGLIISWTGSGTNKIAPYIVATIAEQWYGYRLVGKGLRVQEATLATRSNAHALSHGLLLCTALQ